MDDLFPKLQKSIEHLIEDEEGNIPGNKLLMLGTLVVILGSLLSIDAFAKHRSHSSHSSHRSHSSHSSGSHGNSHYNHGSHESHQSHQSHTSHSNTTSHSNSLYSAEGDVTYRAPSASKVPGITAPPVQVSGDKFSLPKINETIEMPNGTPGSSIIPTLSMPSSSPVTKIDAEDIHTPPPTEEIK